MIIEQCMCPQCRRARHEKRMTKMERRIVFLNFLVFAAVLVSAQTTSDDDVKVSDNRKTVETPRPPPPPPPPPLTRSRWKSHSSLGPRKYLRNYFLLPDGSFNAPSAVAASRKPPPLDGHQHPLYPVNPPAPMSNFDYFRARQYYQYLGDAPPARGASDSWSPDDQQDHLRCSGPYKPQGANSNFQTGDAQQQNGRSHSDDRTFRLLMDLLASEMRQQAIGSHDRGQYGSRVLQKNSP